MVALRSRQTITNDSTSAMSASLIHRRGGAIKAISKAGLKSSTEGWLEGYLVSWGDGSDTDLQGEFFTPRTEFCLDWFTERPVLYHHGLDGQAGLRKIGVIKAVEIDDLGIWVQAQLDLRDRYAVAVYDMIQVKEFGWSSGSVDHLVKIAENGEIAVWPIIEGSITPTPAQPSKTLVRPLKSALNEEILQEGFSAPRTSWRAFKAVIANDNNDNNNKQYLRGLHKYVEARVGQLIDSSRGMKSSNLSNRVQRGKKNMARTAAKRLALAYSKAFGVSASKKELNAVAAELEAEVDEEVLRSAAAELENEALATLDFSEEEPMASRRNKGRYRPTRRGRAYRNENAPSVNAGDLADQMENEIAAQAEAIASDMADGIAADLEDDIAAQMDEVKMAQRVRNSIIKRAYRQAVRQLESTDDPLVDLDTPPVDIGGVGGDEHLADAASESAKRRRSRKEGALLMDEPMLSEEAILSDAEEAILMETVAEKAYANGFKRGLNRALRTDDTVEAPDVSITEVDPPTVASRRSRKEDLELDEETIASRRRRTRNARRKEDDALLQDDEAFAQDDEATASRAFRRGYSMAKRNARRRGRKEDDALLQDDEAFAQDDAMMQDPYEDAAMTAPYAADEPIASRRRYRGKAADLNYWKNRAQELEAMENPGERQFSRVKSVKDVADRPGAYEHAFKSYMQQGLGMMTDSEKYILKGKGQTRWGKATFGNGENEAYKTYFGGTDTAGGFAVPPDWVNELNKNVMTQTVMAPECRTRTTNSDRIVQPSIVTTDGRRAHAAQVRWPGEVIGGNSVHRSVEDTYSQVDVPIHVMMMSLTAGNSALEDIAFNLEDEVNEAFSEAVAVSYDELIWGGDGQGKLEGVVTNSQVTGAASTGMQSVSGYVATGNANGIVTADSFKKMLMHLPRQFRKRAKWYMNSNTALEIATLKDAEGNYLIDQRDESLQNAGVPERLLGRPIVYNDFADDIASAGFPVILGDLSRGYIIGKRVDFSIRRFDDSAYAELDQVLFLGRARIGGQVLLPSAIKVLKVAAS